MRQPEPIAIDSAAGGCYRMVGFLTGMVCGTQVRANTCPPHAPLKQLARRP